MLQKLRVFFVCSLPTGAIYFLRCAVVVIFISSRRYDDTVFSLDNNQSQAGVVADTANVQLIKDNFALR